MKTNWPAMRIGCLIFASAALASGPSLAQNREPAGATATASVISSVAVTQAPERASVRVEGEGPLKVRAARIQNPERLVLDFNGARLAVRNTLIPGVSAPVRGVRLGQYKPDVARVVVDLTAAAPYHISREGTTVVISFAVLPESPAALTLVTKAASEDLRGTKPGFRYEMAAPRNVALRSTRATRVSVPRFALPGELTQPSFVLASFGGKNEPARPSAQAAQQQAGNAAATLANSQATQASPAPTATGRYTGEPISVNLKDVDLKDFFRLVHEISGLNVVLDPAVKGSLTIVLDEVPWDQALDIVLQNFLSQRGDILSDDRSNQLIIRDIPSVIPVIDNLIRQLDRKSQQVEIEARVVSATRSFAQDIGVQLGFAGTATSGRNIAAGTSQVGTSTFGGTIPPSPVTVTGTTPPAMPLSVNLPASGPTSGLLLAHRSPNFAVDFFITAAEAKGVGKLLSKPRVVTQNNEKATVKQGQKIPIQTTINNTVSVQFIDAVLKLEVTPQITAEGTVFMDVLVENTQIDAGIPRVQGIPALDTQSAETKVLVADGGTVVIGGIIISSQNVTTNEVPILGSLPLIGHLFRRSNVVISSSELLFFLTPRVIPG